VVEDDSTAPLIPFLATAAVVARPSSIELVRGDLTRSPLPLALFVREILALGGASLRAWSGVLAARYELPRLLAADRADLASAGTSRVLFVYSNLWLGLKAGGSVGHVAGVVNGLTNAGFHVDLASSIEPVLIKPNVTRLPLRLPGVLGLPFEANYYRFHSDVVHQLRSQVIATSHDFIYYRMSVANYVGVSLSRALRIPLVAEYNGSEVWAARNWGRPLRYERLARDAEDVTFRHAHVVVVVSDVLRDEVLRRGVPPERVAVHPNGVDPDIFSPERFDSASTMKLRKSLGLPADATVVTFVGTFGRWHGVDVLARAIRHLIENEHGWLDARRVRFLLVGDGLKMTEARSILGDATHGFVTLTGLIPQTETPSYLAASDIVVSPHVPNEDGTPFFGSPTKLFEYMAMARGIVASDLGQIGDVLEPALRARCLPETEPAENAPEVAVLTRPGDIDELISGIRFLVERPRWRQVLGAKARARAVARYTWRSHVDTILDRVRSVSGPTGI